MPDAAHIGSTRDRALRWVPVLAWTGVIFAMSSIPGSNLPGGYSFQGHLAEYTVLGALVMLALRHRPRRVALALIALAACSLYGVSDELHQAFVPGRTPDVLDWATDTVGAALGVSATIAWLTWRGSRRAGEEVDG
ncbi:MAG: VanZ family protein [Coriobacteriia bacterium]|nr:VanZ family protein [Coriobacteriia bacterium]